jgi:hypothetical protein
LRIMVRFCHIQCPPLDIHKNSLHGCNHVRPQMFAQHIQHSRIRGLSVSLSTRGLPSGSQ